MNILTKGQRMSECELKKRGKEIWAKAHQCGATKGTAHTSYIKRLRLPPWRHPLISALHISKHFGYPVFYFSARSARLSANVSKLDTPTDTCQLGLDSKKLQRMKNFLAGLYTTASVGCNMVQRNALLSSLYFFNVTHHCTKWSDHIAA